MSTTAQSVPTSALPLPPERLVARSISTTTALTDLLETLFVLSIPATVPAAMISGWLAPLPLLAGIGCFFWARARRRNRALENELDLRKGQYFFTARQLASIGHGDLAGSVANALNVILPEEPVSRWQLLRLLTSEMEESRAIEILPAVLLYASK
jgi:hypothetical protein